MILSAVNIGGVSVPLSLWTTAIGVLCTSAVGILLYLGKRGPYRSGWACLVSGLLLGGVLTVVTRAISGVEAMAGGLTILDTRYPYSVKEVLEFAAALGPDGRAAYAAFQLGFDTWAPPALASFVGSVACATLPQRFTLYARAPIWAYLVSVLLANALMPVVMLAYPALDAPLVRGLLHVVPWLDFAKYTLHLVAWGVILGGWIVLLIAKKNHKGS